jgi:hypothetical protein
MPNTIVLFRTHMWNEEICFIARRLAAMCIGLDFAILADETKNQFDTYPFEKISHTSDFSSFNLLKFLGDDGPMNMMWYCADYAHIFARREKPNYDYYIFAENDLICTEDMSAILKKVADRKIDYVAHANRDCPTNIGYYQTLRYVDGDPKWAFAPFSIYSARAIDHVYESRIYYYDKVKDISDARHPCGEVFVPTCLQSLPNYKYAEISEFVNLIHYECRNTVSIADPICDVLHTIVHPVKSGETCVMKIIEESGIENVLRGSPEVRRKFQFIKPELIRSTIGKLFLRHIEGYGLEDRSDLHIIFPTPS